jgi:Flp pilus assembly protein TadG
MREMRKWMCRDERGQDLVEFAIAVPLLLLILGGVFDLGRSMNNYIIITNAAREAVRYASHFPDDADEGFIKKAAIREAAASGVALLPGEITVIGLNRSHGLPIEVRIEREFPTFLGSVTGVGGLTLRARAEMIVFGRDTGE